MATLDKIRLSGTTYDIIDSTAVHSLDGYWTTGETTNAITAATNALAESIAEMNYATTGYVQEAIAEASGVTTGQVQSMIDSSISGKADTTAVTQAISEATSGKANSSDAIKTIVPQVFTAQEAEIGEMNLKFTKADGTNSTLTQFIGAGSGITITKNIYNGADLSVDTTVIAQKSDIPSVSGYADAVKYDSTAQEVKFYHGGTGGTEVFSFDASPFLIDGMIESVVITSITSGSSEVEVLQITWNSAAGGQVTNIPLSDIFDASNYYTTAQTDTKISEATSGKVDTSTYTAYTAATDTALGNKADTTAVTQAISEATSGKADASSTVTDVTLEEFGNGAKFSKTVNGTTSGIGVLYGSDTITISKPAGWTSGSLKIEAVSTTAATSGSTALFTSGGAYEALSGKQATLVSGTNIKTVNNNSLLGSGNIDIQTGLQASVDGTTLIFS